MPGGGGGPYPPPARPVPEAHLVADPVELYPSSPYVPGTVVEPPVSSSAVGSYVPPSVPAQTTSYDSYQQGGGTGYPPPVMGQPVGGRLPNQQQQPHQQTILVEVNPRQPMQVQCPQCGQVVTTVVQYAANAMTFLGCIGFGLLGFVPCMILPFCMPACQSAVHVCPNCRAVVAVA